jgi:hypothetical protein
VANDPAPKERASVLVAAGVLGLVLFAWLGGLHIVPLHAVDWIDVRSDRFLYWLSWLHYQDAPLAFPLGHLPTLLAPQGTSLLATDALPLFSVLVRALLGPQPGETQILGVWYLLVFVGQGVLGARLALTLGLDRRSSLLCAGLLLLTPFWLDRLQHASLSTHGLLLGALTFALRPTPRPPRAEPVVLVIAAAGTSPYLCAMTLVLLLAGLARMALAGVLVGRRALRHALALLAGAILVLWLLGALELSPHHGENSSTRYRADAAAFVDPAGASNLLEPLAIDPAHEGMAFLGLPVLALAALALVLSVARRPATPRPPLRPYVPVLVVLVGCFVYALSWQVTVLGHEVLDIEPLYASFEGLTRSFRASGRFTWPVGYAVMALVVVVIHRHAGRATAPILAVALLLGVADSAVVQHGTPFEPGPPGAMPARLVDARWRAAAPELEHLVTYPALARDNAGQLQEIGRHDLPLLALARLAAELEVDLNGAIVTRANRLRFAVDATRLDLRILRGELDPRTLYVVSYRYLPRFKRFNRRAVCARLDQVTVCAAPDASPGVLAALQE